MKLSLAKSEVYTFGCRLPLKMATASHGPKKMRTGSPMVSRALLIKPMTGVAMLRMMLKHVSHPASVSMN